MDDWNVTIPDNKSHQIEIIEILNNTKEWKKNQSRLHGMKIHAGISFP